MKKKLLKISIYSILFITIVSGLFVICDYYELFGTTIEKRLDFAEVRLRIIDADMGGIVMNAGARCFQKHNMNACTLKDSHQLGIVSVNVPVQKAVKKTLLFKKAEEIYNAIDPNINIMIIHSDYHNSRIQLAMKELYLNNVIEKTIEMSPKDRGNSEPENEE